VIETNLLCASQQGYDIEFALLIGVMCHVMNASKWGTYLSCIWCVTPFFTPWKTFTLSTPNDNNFVATFASKTPACFFQNIHNHFYQIVIAPSFSDLL
jgi:hypothetical protein